MPIQKITTVQPTSTNNKVRTGLVTLGGAALGVAARYLAPTKDEARAMINQNAVDTFVASSKIARANNRSLIKYAGIGALIGFGINLIAKAIKSAKEAHNSFEFSKYGALIDAPDYACEIMWYED